MLAARLARAAPSWAVICLTVLLPLSRLADAGNEEHAILAAVLVLLISAGVGLLVLAADGIHERI